MIVCTWGIRMVDCVEMFNDVRNTNIHSTAKRKSSVLCLVQDTMVEFHIRRTSHVRIGTGEYEVSTLGK
jgi:hypothetical protein